MNYKPSINHSPSASSPDVRNDFGFPMADTIGRGNCNQVHAAEIAKGNTVMLFLWNKIVQLKVDELTFFRIAHVWAFGTDPDLTGDIIAFRDHGVIPAYVKNYVKTLQ